MCVCLCVCVCLSVCVCLCVCGGGGSDLLVLAGLTDSSGWSAGFSEDWRDHLRPANSL